MPMAENFPHEEEQGRLFSVPDEESQPDNSIDISDRARQIGEFARPYTPVDRTSDAARDQGHGPVDNVTGIEDAGSSSERNKAKRRGIHPSQRPFEKPQQGRNNAPGLITPAEAQQGLTDDEIDAQSEINSRGAAAAREALKKAQERKSNPDN